MFSTTTTCDMSSIVSYSGIAIFTSNHLFYATFLVSKFLMHLVLPKFFVLWLYISGIALRRLIILLVCIFNAIIGFVLIKSFFATDKTRKVLRMVDPTVPVMAYEPVMKQQNTDLGFLLQLASRDNLRDKHPCFNLRKDLPDVFEQHF